MMDVGEPLAVAATEAVRTGDVATLRRLLRESPDLATCRLSSERDRKRDMSRTLLHVVTDWPGHFPNGVATVQALIDAGADVDARFTGPHTETPLHWAASSDDVDVLDALLDAGADIEARGAVIGGGTPMADATAFGQWNAARRLLERGAATTRWEASALGLLDRVTAYFAADLQASQDDATPCLWGACHGGHLEVAQYLVDQGADANWVGWDDLTALDVAERSEAADVVEWLQGRGAKRAADITTSD